MTAPTPPRSAEPGFAEALHRAVQASGLSFRALAEAVTVRGTPVSPPTLRSWAAGRSHPTRSGSLQVLAGLEEVLELGPGMLQRHLQRDVDPSKVADVPILQRLTELARGFLRDWDCVDVQGLIRDLTVSTLLLESASDGHVHHCTVLRAIHSGVDRTVIGVDGTGWVDPAQWRASAVVRGARIERVAELEDGLLLVELVLPRPLHADETTVIDIACPLPPRSPRPDRYRVLCLLPTTRLVAKVATSPSASPLTFTRSSVSIDGRGPEQRRVAAQLTGISADCAISNASAGLATISWAGAAAPSP